MVLSDSMKQLRGNRCVFKTCSFVGLLYHCLVLRLLIVDYHHIQSMEWPMFMWCVVRTWKKCGISPLGESFQRQTWWIIKMRKDNWKFLLLKSTSWRVFHFDICRKDINLTTILNLMLLSGKTRTSFIHECNTLTHVKGRNKGNREQNKNSQESWKKNMCKFFVQCCVVIMWLDHVFVERYRLNLVASHCVLFYGTFVMWLKPHFWSDASSTRCSTDSSKLSKHKHCL